MDLRPDQHFVYAWCYTDDTACKLGYSTTRTFYSRIKAAKTVTHQPIELLGVEVFSTEAAARAAYQQRLETFQRLADRRAWVHLTDAVWKWLNTECLPNPPTLEDFKAAFLKDPVRREKERTYQRRTSRKRAAAKRRQKRTGRTEQQRAYEREYQRKRRETDPAYREKQKQRQKAWRAKHPDYDKKRYANDPEYAEKHKAVRRKKYAEDPAYREQQKTRWNEWKQENPNYRQRRTAYMREWRKKNPDYDKNRYRAKVAAEEE